MKIPLLLVSFSTMNTLGRRFKGLGKTLLKLQPRLGATLTKIGIEVEPEAYVIGSLFSSLFYGIAFFAISLAALAVRVDVQDPVRTALPLGFAFWLVFFLLHLIHPTIILKKIAAKENKDLLFALREIVMNAESGVPLFDSMKNVGSGNYGYISQDFEWVTKQIESGVPERDALKSLALKTENEYMRRTVWQIVNALESGASLANALPGIVQSLENHIFREIKDYSSNLNFLMLIYMLSAAVVPSLGITFMVLLSAFSGLGVTLNTVAILVVVSSIMQLILIGFMSSTRPEVFGG